MGVPWGIETAKTSLTPLGKTVAAWLRVAEADVCRRFTIPIDATFCTFDRAADGKVKVTTAERPELLAAISALKCGEGTYDEFESLFDGYSLFFPDGRGERAIPKGLMRDCRSAHSLSRLRGLRGGRLAKELAATARFAAKHDLIVGISF